MPNENRNQNTTKDTRKPLPQSNIIGKRKEIFDLNLIKIKRNTTTNFCAYLFVPY